MPVIAQFAQNFQAGIVTIYNANLPFTIVKFIFAGDVFQAYDYGKIGNEKRYGSKKPMEYNLKKVTAPVR